MCEFEALSNELNVHFSVPGFFSAPPNYFDHQCCVAQFVHEGTPDVVPRVNRNDLFLSCDLARTRQVYM